MSVRLHGTCLREHVEVSVIDSGVVGVSRRELAPERWKEQPGPVSVPIRKLLSLMDDGDAEWRGNRLAIPNRVAALFNEGLASSLGLPPAAPVTLDVGFHKTIGDPEAHVELEWKDAHYRPLLPSRLGIALTSGGHQWRLTGPVFALVEAIEAFNRSRGEGLHHRVACWSDVRDALGAVDPEAVNQDEYTKGLTIFQAGSFALDVTHQTNRIDFQPVLMSRSKSRSLEDNAPTEDVYETEGSNQDQAALADEHGDALLVTEDHKSFLRQFDAGSKHAYRLRRNTYLLLDPALRVALDVVRRMQTASVEQKRAFIKNPRTVIAQELGVDGGSELVTALFIETKQYSDRVVGMGLWEKPELPWLRKASWVWLPERFPARVHTGGQNLEIDEAEAETLKAKVEVAQTSDAATVVFRGRDIPLDSARDILSQIDIEVGDQPQPVPEPGTPPDRNIIKDPAASSDRAGPLAIQIKTNYQGVEYEISRQPRHAAIQPKLPIARLAETKPKSHQMQGFEWLVAAWGAGWPGVLLADDMGLGKTFQALAFLAWIAENGAARSRVRAETAHAPVLIVAPTALLDNWLDEARQHLAAGALGNIAKLYGVGIRAFKQMSHHADASGELLDQRKLRAHDLVLTTYETLADYHTALAKVPWSIGIFDEVQKIKDPGTLNTLASKAMNVDFVLALTGTPIENRIEDIWSIMDRVFPGYLRDLESFSRLHEDANDEKFRALKQRLSNPVEDAPAIMLRRMKEDVLEGLPRKEVIKYRTVMPAPQSEAYDSVVHAARVGRVRERGRAAMLEVVQQLRTVSLYPDDPWRYALDSEAGCRAWLERSARLGKTLEILRTIDRKREKVLIFVEHRFMQERLAEALTTLFKLDHMPFIINGSVPGPKRKKRVDAFQARRTGFDVLILSPKAAGIGLTITAANHVIHLSRWWNPAVEDQCNDRVYRIGQAKPVTIHIPMALHPALGDKTFDAKLDELLERKRRLSRTLLAPPVSDDDLDEMFAGAVAA